MGPQHWRLYFKWNIELQNIKTADKITSREGLAGDASRPIQLSQGWQDEMFSDVWICGILCSLLLPKVGVPGSLSNIRRAQSTLPIRWPCGRGPCCCCCCSTQKTKNSHTLDYLLDSFSQLSQFWFSDIRITNGGMCLMRKALFIKLSQKWFEPNLTRSGSLIDVKDNDNDDATCSSVGRSRCFACLLGGRWKNQQFCSIKQSQKMIAPRV